MPKRGELDEIADTLARIDDRLRTAEAIASESRDRDCESTPSHHAAEGPVSLDSLLDRLGCPPVEPAVRHLDVVVAGITGLSGGLLDLRKTFAEAMTSEDWHQQLDRRFKDYAKENVGPGTIAIDNASGGPSHRLVGPTHDIFRLFKAVRLVREGRFESAVSGVLKSATSYRGELPPYVKVDDPTDALMLVLLHWSGDFFSAMSLPIPGWSLLAESENAQFVRTLFIAYRNGANLRTAVSQLLSNFSGVALITVILHFYRWGDMLTASGSMDVSALKLGLAQDLRYRWMSRNAGFAASGVSVGRVAVTGDLFSLNYAALAKAMMDARVVERLLDAENAGLDGALHDFDLATLEGIAWIQSRS